MIEEMEVRARRAGERDDGRKGREVEELEGVIEIVGVSEKGVKTQRETK